MLSSTTNRAFAIAQATHRLSKLVEHHPYFHSKLEAKLDRVYIELQSDLSAATRKHKDEDCCPVYKQSNDKQSNDVLQHCFGSVSDKQYGLVACASESLITTIYKTIYEVPPEVLRLIFTFLGSGYFIFIGGTSRIFRELYLSTSVGARASELTVKLQLKTSYHQCPVSSCIYRKQETDVAQLRVILNSAASYGW